MANEKYDAEAALYVDSDSNLSMERMHVDATKFVHKCYHAAETHDNQSIRTIDSDDDDNELLHASVTKNISYDENDDDDDDDENDDVDAGHLLEYHTEAATETLNLLLPETQPTAALDCSNFMDFDEFNLCLNNMFSDDVEFIADAGLNVALEQQQQQQQQQSNYAQTKRSQQQQQQQQLYNEVADETLSNDNLDLHFMPYNENIENIYGTDARATTTTTASMEIMHASEQEAEQSPMQEFYTPTITGGFVGSDTEGECSSDSNTLSFGSATNTTTASAATTTIAANRSVNTNAVDVISCNNHNVVNIFQ